MANLFLHHFPDARLRELLSLAAQRAGGFAACEPRRSAVVLGTSQLLGLLGCNEVTRFDAVLSVQAGFRGQELSALWPADPGWHLEEGGAGLFSHCCVVSRCGTSSLFSALNVATSQVQAQAT